MTLTYRPRSLFFRIVSYLASGLSSGRERAEQLESLKEIMSHYDSLITRVCFSFSRNRGEFDDMRQDTIINIWKGLGGFRREASLKTWVYRIALNTCSTYLRRSRYEFVSLEEIVFRPDTDPADRENVEYLHSLISRLNPLDKSIILLWLDDYSYEEISAMTSIKRNTVASRIHRIKNNLIRLNNDRSI